MPDGAANSVPTGPPIATLSRRGLLESKIGVTTTPSTPSA